MRSARSWFNLTLYKKNLTRFWPIWGLYLLIWLFVFPISLILDNYGDPFRFAHWNVLSLIKSLGLPLAAVFSLLAACAVWSYLCNNRAVCLMHTLPVRREGLFLTNFLSGMTFLVGPNLIVFILTLLAEAARGAVDAGSLAMWFFSVTLMELFFFSFATFCAMFTGHILGLPAFYAILNVLAAGLVWLLDLTLSRFVFGYAGIQGLWSAAEWLTPVWKLEANLEVRVQTVDGMRQYGTAWLSGLGYILVYVIFGLILAGLALMVYRRRDMERVGDVVTVPWMRPVFQYGVAFCCALAFGSLFYEIFCGALPEGAWTLLVFMLLCGAAGYFLARMLLEKSFRVFHRWKGCVPFLAALVVLVCVMEFDLTGFERRVPDAEDVASVTICNMDTAPYDAGSFFNVETSDPAVIRAVVEAHQAVADSKDAIERGGMPGSGTVETSGFEVVYTLKSGKAISRDYSYEIPVSAEALDDPESPAAKLDALVNLPQMIEEMYGLAGKSAEDVISMTLTSYTPEEGYREIAVSRDAREKVFQAVQADFAEGNLGRRYLLTYGDDRRETCFVNDLTITFYEEKQQAEPSDRPAAAAERTEVTPSTRSVTVTLQTTAKHTLAALQEAGVLEGQVNLFTHVQADAAEAQEKNGESWTESAWEEFAWAVLEGS
ncbi:MAG: ABC transporter permease [Oscillospiraceae bacterium]